MCAALSPLLDEIPVGAEVEILSSKYTGRVIAKVGGYYTVSISTFIDGTPIADYTPWTIDVPSTNLRVLDIERTLDDRIRLGRTYAFSQLHERQGRIWVNPYRFTTTLAVIFDNEVLPLRHQKRVQLDPLSEDTKEVPMSTALRVISKGLMGKFNDTYFQRYLLRLEILRPWDNYHECIINITEVVLSAHGKWITFTDA